MIKIREHQFVEEAATKLGVLKVQIHEAKGIHNICIYDKQDVFAKLSLTHGEGEPVCTSVVSKGGKDPVFNEKFQLSVTVPDSVFKCEMWMSSRAHSYLEDQLLGFVLVPLLSLTRDEQGQAREYALTSTELFHSPAGIVRLTLALFLDHEQQQQQQQQHVGLNEQPVKNNSSRHCPYIKVFEDGLSSPESTDDVELFPDIQAASEDQKLVSDFLNKGQVINGIVTGPHFLFTQQLFDSPASSSSTSQPEHNKIMNGNSQEEHTCCEHNSSSSSSSSPPLAIQQQQIVDMYVKSMQQFTEALAKMQLPVDLEASKKKNKKQDKSSKGHRVFYGSRAFF